MRLKPVDGMVVNPERVEVVVSPAYDALTPTQRYRYANKHPGNYLNVMRSREEYPEGERPTAAELLAANGKRLQEMISAGDFLPRDKPAYYIYRLSAADHVQTGVVADIPVAEYLDGRVKKHEHTQALKEDDLTTYQREVRATSSPICLTYASSEAVDTLVASLTEASPLLDFVAEDGVRQSVWAVDDHADIERLEQAFATVEVAYLTDGHHRAASGARFMELERADNPRHTGDESYNFLLVSFFPADQLRILEYNRLVARTAGKTVDEVLAGMAASFEVEPLTVSTASDARPGRRGEFGVFLEGRWYRLKIRPSLVPDDLVDALDVSILQEHLLAPVLGINEPRTDPNISYLPGAVSLEALERECTERHLIGIAVYPTAIEDLMAVADASRVMPPKSTWFEPKLRSGLFLLLR